MENGNVEDKEKRTASGLNSLASETAPLLRKILGKKGFALTDIMMFWEQIVGEELAAFSFPEKLTFKNGERQNGVLSVAVANGAFALEMQYREKTVLDKINGYFGYRAVSVLKIRQSAGSGKRKAPQFHQPEKKILVSCEEQNYIEQLTGQIQDEKLRDSLIRLGQNVLYDNRE